jgi:ABC-type polysaccharide/polyol phosphate transport system ATPase subunit
MNKVKRLIVNNIHKKYKIGIKKRRTFLESLIDIFMGNVKRTTIEVLRGVSFSVDSGEILGIIGKNGSGKSTLLRIISGIVEQDKGEVAINGKTISLINLTVGLKDRLTMKDNIFLIGSLFGMSQKEIIKRYSSIVNFAELEQYENTKIYQFSSGMRQRLAFSIAISSEPDILILDEVFEVGDEKFKKKSSDKIKELAKKGGSVILVSHDMDLINKNCDRIINIDGGKIAKIK